jgi:hypothetical protein
MEKLENFPQINRVNSSGAKEPAALRDEDGEFGLAGASRRRVGDAILDRGVPERTDGARRLREARDLGESFSSYRRTMKKARNRFRISDVFVASSVAERVRQTHCIRTRCSSGHCRGCLEHLHRGAP